MQRRSRFPADHTLCAVSSYHLVISPLKKSFGAVSEKPCNRHFKWQVYVPGGKSENLRGWWVNFNRAFRTPSNISLFRYFQGGVLCSIELKILPMTNLENLLLPHHFSFLFLLLLIIFCIIFYPSFSSFSSFTLTFSSLYLEKLFKKLIPDFIYTNIGNE